MKKKDPNQISDAQRGSLNLFCEQLGQSLNDAGHSVPHVLAQSKRYCVDMPWTQHLVKELLWKRIQFALTGIESSEKIASHLTVVFDTVNKSMGETFGVHVPFPSNEEIMRSQQ